MLRKTPIPGGDGWYSYAVELKDVRCTVLEGKVFAGDKVYLPYIPMSSHG